ncbi:hypothetical protein [Streptomyces sp. NPDC087856]|uniref:hypothetical protein n=1 Tax=Streptomyces sp. NPDC087856 TaxID=3365811 RepID=UPI0037F1F791
MTRTGAPVHQRRHHNPDNPNAAYASVAEQDSETVGAVDCPVGPAAPDAPAAAHAGITGPHLDAGPPRTNPVFFTVDGDLTSHTTDSLSKGARALGVHLAQPGRGRIRAVIHSGFTSTGVDRAVTVIADVLATAPEARQ